MSVPICTAKLKLEIADIQHDSPEISDSLIAGFLLAIDDWRKYHVKQILELDRVEAKLNDQV